MSTTNRKPGDARDEFGFWTPDYDCRVGDQFKSIDTSAVYTIQHISFTGDFIATPDRLGYDELYADLRALDVALRQGDVVAVSGCAYKTIPGPTPITR